MKINKTSMLVLLAAGGLLAATPAIRAQETNAPSAQPPRGNAADRLNKQAEELKLTDDQKTKFVAAQQDYRKTMREIHQDTSLSDDDKKDKMKAAHEQLDASMKSILTPDQYDQWKSMNQHHHQPRSGGTNAPRYVPSKELICTRCATRGRP